ncbi:MAG: hypothetical protein KAU22_08560, partial [Desulfuromonadales bacterium]|nr:hypothetical protein [Desulfuromonadales bacterium]
MAGNVLNSLSGFVYRQKKKKIVQLTAEFNSQQWLGQDELLAKCDELTLKLLRHSYRQVPYYRKIVNEQGLSIDDFKFPEDWQRIPLLGKSELNNHFEELKSENTNSRKSYLNHTGGSTGVPVNFLTDFVQAQRMTAWLDLAYSWAGWKPGDIRLELWGNKEQRVPLNIWDRVRASLSGHFVLPVYE